MSFYIEIFFNRYDMLCSYIQVRLTLRIKTIFFSHTSLLATQTSCASNKSKQQLTSPNLFFFVYRPIIVGFPDKTKPQTTPVNGQAIPYQRKKN